MQRALIIIRLRCGRDSRQLQHEHYISADAVILVDLLAIVYAAEDDDGEEILRDAHGGLQEDQDIGDEAHDAVHGVEAVFWVGGFVYLDDDKGGYEAEVGEGEKAEVGQGAAALLGRGVGWLEDEDGLGG